MAKGGHFKFKDLENFAKQLENMQKEHTEVIIERIAKEVAARLLRKIYKRTPVGQYDSPKGKKGKKAKKGGMLRRGWTVDTEAQAESKKVSVDEFIESIKVEKQGSKYLIKIANPVHYAPYVEYGHRARNGEWVPGEFMLTESENEIGQDLESMVNKQLGKELAKVLFK